MNVSSAKEAAFPVLECETAVPELYSRSFLPVDSEEIAFALTVFVAAANRQLAYKPEDFSKLPAVSRHECETLFMALSASDFTRLPSLPMLPVTETSIQVAFMALWHHYEGNALRHSICARVLGFYYLMERTGGTRIHRWIDPCPGQPESVLLHAEVVEAIAQLALGREGQFSEQVFHHAIEELEKGSAEA